MHTLSFIEIHNLGSTDTDVDLDTDSNMDMVYGIRENMRTQTWKKYEYKYLLFYY